jgi:hypothetical protein
MKLTTDQCNEIISWTDKFGKSNVRYCPDVCSPAGLHKSRLDYNITEVKRVESTQWFFDIISDFISEEYPNNKVKEGDFFYAHEFLSDIFFHVVTSKKWSRNDLGPPLKGLKDM